MAQTTNIHKERNYNKFKIYESLRIERNLNTVNIKTDIENINYYNNSLLLHSSNNNNNKHENKQIPLKIYPSLIYHRKFNPL